MQNHANASTVALVTGVPLAHCAFSSTAALHECNVCHAPQSNSDCLVSNNSNVKLKKKSSWNGYYDSVALLTVGCLLQHAYCTQISSLCKQVAQEFDDCTSQLPVGLTSCCVPVCLSPFHKPHNMAALTAWHKYDVHVHVQARVDLSLSLSLRLLMTRLA